MKTKMIVRFDDQEVVGKMLELLLKQHEAAVEASEQEDEEFHDWLGMDSTNDPTADPCLSIYRYALAQALLAANGIEVGLCAVETEIEEDGSFIVRYWE